MDKIQYKDIIDLGFTEEEQSDSIYFNQYGFQWCIIQKELTKKIYLEWAKETQLCEIIRIDSKKTGNIKKRLPIKNLKQLKEIIDFYSDKEEIKINIYSHA